MIEIRGAWHQMCEHVDDLERLNHLMDYCACAKHVSQGETLHSAKLAVRQECIACCCHKICMGLSYPLIYRSVLLLFVFGTGSCSYTTG
jgi:hypothetical protein